MSYDVIDNYDLDNNALFIRGCNLIGIAAENRYLQNAWFALTGNLFNEEQIDRLIQNTNAGLKKTDPTAKLQAMHQLINVLPSLSLTQRFMMLLSQVEVSAAQGNVMVPVSEGDCLKIILLMPWIIALARSSQKFSYLPAIENCNTFECAFWLALTSKEASSDWDIDMLCLCMPLLLSGFGTVTPTTTTTIRFIASTKNDVFSALIGGFCATGPTHMGACKYAIMRLSSVFHEIEAGNLEAGVTHYYKDKLWPGFGHPIMQRNVRIAFFFYAFRRMRFFSLLALSISGNTGLQPNVDFLIASIMSKHRAAPELGLLAFLVCRMPILLAHYQERFSSHSFGLSSKNLREKYKKGFPSMAIKHRTKPNFLGICQSITLTAPMRACGQIDVSHWDLAHNYLKQVLLLEALHQFLVSFATVAAKNLDLTYRYLPVMVEQFFSTTHFVSDRLRVEGHIKRINEAYRIHCKASSYDSGSAVIAQATIIVSKVCFPGSYSEKAALPLLSDLWKISSVTEDSCTFSFNAHHLLFEEHFPSRAVCPGSRLIEMVLALDTQGRAKSIASVALKKVKFIEAVYPGDPYQLTIKQDTECEPVGVFYIHTETKKRRICGQFSIKYKKKDTPCLT